MAQIVIAPEAIADLAAAKQWYQDQRWGLGDDFELCIEATLQAIAAHPERFPLTHRSLRKALIRRYPYLVVYRVLADLVVVIAVVHTSRSPKAWQSRPDTPENEA